MFSRLRIRLTRRRPSPESSLPSLFTPEFRADVEHNSRRWDDEWLSYWVTEKQYSYKYFINRRTIDEQEVEKHRLPLKKLTEEECFNFDPLGYNSLAIWAKGKWIPDATIAELGCGPGILGKAVGPFCRQYIGIDYSQLALHVARLTSPLNCRYLHLSDVAELDALAATCDLCVGRYFFIHQNWKNACWVLRLYRHLLKDGGRVSADFFAPGGPDTAYDNAWMIRNPEDPLNEEQPSCMFAYTDDHIRRLAAECGFKVKAIDYRPAYQRRFAILMKR
jgi:SAM-dependent methyltransferase